MDIAPYNPSYSKMFVRYNINLRTFSYFLWQNISRMNFDPPPPPVDSLLRVSASDFCSTARPFALTAFRLLLLLWRNSENSFRFVASASLFVDLVACQAYDGALCCGTFALAAAAVVLADDVLGQKIGMQKQFGALVALKWREKLTIREEFIFNKYKIIKFFIQFFLILNKYQIVSSIRYT